MNIRVEKVGGIWHGTIDEHPDVDVRGLTEEIARRKIEDLAKTLPEKNAATSKPRGDHNLRRPRSRR